MSATTPASGRVNLTHVRAALAGSTPLQVRPFLDEASAAVAIILADAPEGLELLLIRRATRAGDPWSGHMGLPGGRFEPEDALLWRTAVRETREETGIDLGAAELLGCLEPIAAIARGRRMGLRIVPFVFALEARPVCIHNDEVDETLWTSVAPLYRGTLDTQLELDPESGPAALPAWNVDGRVVWGLTHAMLDGLLRRIRALPGAPSVVA